MNGSGTLAPPSIEGRARPFTRAGAAFGRRAFFLLLIGFAWLIPAFVEPRFVAAMFAWDGLVAAATQEGIGVLTTGRVSWQGIEANCGIGLLHAVLL